MTHYDLVDNTVLHLVPCDDRTQVTATGPVVHLCPFADEVDHGTVTVTWTTDGATVELHSLRAYLDTFAGEKHSHEALAAIIRADLGRARGILNPEVSVAFVTAGLSCRADALG